MSDVDRKRTKALQWEGDRRLLQEVSPTAFNNTAPCCLTRLPEAEESRAGVREIAWFPESQDLQGAPNPNPWDKNRPVGCA